MADRVIERLSSSHDRNDFSCGNDVLDNFLKNLAGQYEKRRLGRTFVAVERGATRVLGFYTSAAGSVAIEVLPAAARKGFPKHAIPTVHLGRLAVDRSCQGKRLGETLLFHFLHTALQASADLGVFAVDVRATDEQASRFYVKYGFAPLDDAPLHLYLPIKTVEKMFAP
jgi:ribosomal protein S18 acetylase RimI-like enzyme